MKPNDSVEGETSIQGYWRVFDGPISLVRPTYFWAALLLTIALPDMWATAVGSQLVWPFNIRWTLRLACWASQRAEWQ